MRDTQNVSSDATAAIRRVERTTNPRFPFRISIEQHGRRSSPFAPKRRGRALVRAYSASVNTNSIQASHSN